MGPFLIEGYFELVMVPDLVEKEGLKVDNQQNQEEPLFMKLKIAKFIFQKKYQAKSLQELVEEKKEYRKQQQAKKQYLIQK